MTPAPDEATDRPGVDRETFKAVAALIDYGNQGRHSRAPSILQAIDNAEIFTRLFFNEQGAADNAKETLRNFYLPPPVAGPGEGP